jgi:hypothetical protein
MDRLFLRHNGGQVITVEGNAQVGRGRGERRDPTTWYTDRPKPPDFAELELVIDIDGSPHVPEPRGDPPRRPHGSRCRT